MNKAGSLAQKYKPLGIPEEQVMNEELLAHVENAGFGGTITVKHTGPEQLFDTGLYFLHINEIREAVVAFKQAVQMMPEEPRYLSYLGLSLGLLDKKDILSIRLCEYALSLDETGAELYSNLGRLYHLQDDPGKAGEIFSRGIMNSEDAGFLKTEMEKLGLEKSFSRAHSWIKPFMYLIAGIICIVSGVRHTG